MQTLKKLWEYSNESKSTIIKSSLYTVLNKFFDLAPPVLIGLAVDVVVDPKASFLNFLGLQERMSQLSVLGFLTFIIWVLESWTEYLFQVGFRDLAQLFQHKLRNETFTHIQKLSNNYFENQSTGNLLSIINDDINLLEGFLNNGFSKLILVFSAVTMVGVLFFIIAPDVAILSFTPIPLIIIGSFVYQRKIEPLYKDVRNRAGIISSFLNNTLTGITTVKAYCREKFEATKLSSLSESYQEVNSRAIKLSSSFTPIIRMTVLIGFLINLLYGGYLVDQGELAVGSYSILIFMIQRLLWPLTDLATTFDTYQRAMASAQRIFNIHNTPIDIQSGDQNFKENEFKGSISFENVTFAYPFREPVLREINFHIKPGQTIAFVGPTGSGKSTLVKLMLRLYDIEQGIISIDGHSIKDLDLNELRECFSYVGQEVYLFDGNIRENLLFGQLDASEDKMIEAAQLAEAHDFIMSLPEGYDTVIGERGQKLSGGQRQRLSIARAILKDAPIFIFDEATSAVDNETEGAIQRSFLRITQLKTTFIIAHRLSTIVNADKIFVLHKGKIAQQGNHKQLIHTPGIYANLWNVQTGGTHEINPEHLVD